MLTFQLKDNAVKIIRNGTCLYSLAKGDKPLYIGNGKNTYAMSHGTFKIKETASKPVALEVKSLNIDGDTLKVGFGKCGAELSLDGDRLFVHMDAPSEYNRLYIKIPALPDEHVYGTGEIFSEFDLRGKKVNCWVAEHINAMQVAKKLVKQVFGFRDSMRKQRFSNYETYYAQPTFLSSQKYFFHTFATARCEFDFTDRKCHTVTLDEIADFCFGFGDTFEEVLSELSLTLGRQPELPDWVYDGEILGIQGGTEVMMNKVDTALSNNMAVSGVWIQDWEGRRTVIHFGGVSSAMHVRLNGREVGYSEDSRLPAEFDLTPYLVRGENRLEVEVFKHSDGTYLEDQDFWRLSGIFRDVWLVSELPGAARDLIVEATLSDDYREGRLVVRDEKGGTLLEKAYANPKLWNAGEPNLYYETVPLRDATGARPRTDYRAVAFGFRKIEIRDAVVYVNGTPRHIRL